MFDAPGDGRYDAGNRFFDKRVNWIEWVQWTRVHKDFCLLGLLLLSVC